MPNKRRSIVILFLVLIVLMGGGAWYVYARPLTQPEVIAEIHATFDQSRAMDFPASGIQARIRSKKYGIDDSYAVGTVDSDGRQPLRTDQPFHAASVGKLFTAVVVMQLQEEGTLDIADPIAQYLPADVLAGLFVVDGVDHSAEVTITQLMEHTSGVADYFADPVATGVTVEQDIVTNRDTRWTPAQLLDVTRTRQTAVGLPGKQFHYSDTGFVLLGLLIEQVEHKPFHQVLHERFFSRLGMTDTYMPYRSTPTNPHPLPLADIWLDGVNLRDARSVTADWAGGGVATTLDDLLRFGDALYRYTLITKESFLRMSTMRQQFRPGIYYGVGMMALRFVEFNWALDFLPESLGHLGITGVHFWYDPLTETAVVMNYGSNAMLEQGFMDLITIETLMRRIETP